MKKLIPTLLFLCALAPAGAQTDMLNGLRARYSFDGNVADVSGNGFDGTLKGLAHVNDVRLILNDNNKDNLTLPAEILNGAGDFSITFKVAFKSFHVSGENNPTNTVVSAWGSELDRIWIAYNRNTKTWDFSINGEMVSYSATFINENNLFCLFFVREGDSAKIYVDADKFATFPINTTALDISNLVIGQHANCTDECFLLKQCLNGHVEQLAFWDRALNNDEIDLACHIPLASFTSESAPCADGSAIFTNWSEHADLYAWDFGDGNTSTEWSPVHTYAASGEYTVTLISTNQWNDISDTITQTVTVSTAGLSAGISAGGSTIICDGSSVELSASPEDAASYQWWLNGSPIDGATSQTYVATGAGTYSVNVSDAFGCSGTSDGLEVSVNSSPVVSISPSGAVDICEGSTQTFTATADEDVGYQWMINGSPISGATESTYTASEAGIYSVMVTNSNECSANSANAALTVNANPVAAITAGGPVSFCEGGNVDLAATEGDGFTYQWQLNGSDISGATDSHFSATEEGDYSVTILSAEGCSDESESVAVSVKPNPPASIEPDGVVSACAGSGQEFTANEGPGLTYQWMLNGSPIEGETDLTYTTNISGDYSVVVTASNGCSTTSAAVSLTVNANPEITITSNGSTTLCEGQSVELMANGVGDLDYEWKYNGSVISGATNATYVASEAGTYTVKVTDTNGCKNAADPITVIVNPVPIANIDPAEDISFCSGNSQVYTANDGIDLSYQWTWNGEPIDGATAISYEATESGAYAVIVTDAAGCSASSSVSNLTVNALPDVSVSSNGPTEFCDGGSVELSATGGENSYQWFMNGEEIDGANSENYTATASGSYSVVITDANGCKNQSEEVTVNVNANPVATIDPASDMSFCEGGVQVYEANDGDGLSYQWTWNGESIEGATAASYEATQTGTYAVIVTNESGCTATSSGSTLTVNENPEASIDPAGTIELCEGESATINANSGNNLTYQWEMNGEPIDGATNQSYSTGDAGNYSVVVTSDAGCSSVSAEVTVSVNPLPVVFLGSDTTICDTSSITLDAGAGFESYEWSTEETTQTITVNQSGVYSVTVADANGCSATDEMELTVDVCTGISEAVFASSVSIYPNPTFGLFTISVNLPAVDRIRIDLMNALGQLVLPVYDGQLASSFTREVDLKEYAKGVYIIRFMFDGQVVNKKVVNAE